VTLTTRIIASGAGWQASEVRCCAGPDDPAFEEQHERVCMAVPPLVAGPQWLSNADAVLDDPAATEESACELAAGVAMSTIDARRRPMVPRRQGWTT